MGSYQHASAWSRVPIARIEDLSDAVYGAGLEATQMSAGSLSGSLAFAERDGVLGSSGLINGRVTLYGPLSSDMVTLGIGVCMAPGTRHWLNEVETGGVGVFHAGDDHDALYTQGSIYAAVTLSEQMLEEEAAKQDLVLDHRLLGGTGIHGRKIPPDVVKWLQFAFIRVHNGRATLHDDRIGDVMINALIGHLARPPYLPNKCSHQSHYEKIVARARAHIHEHLDEPMSVDEIAAASFTSRRTLFRAFAEILEDTPHTYVRRLRLHRIRHDLASDIERTCTIALIANQWGLGDLGRMSGWYRELFGERPSITHSIQGSIE